MVQSSGLSLKSISKYLRTVVSFALFPHTLKFPSLYFTSGEKLGIFAFLWEEHPFPLSCKRIPDTWPFLQDFAFVKPLVASSISPPFYFLTPVLLGKARLTEAMLSAVLGTGQDFEIWSARASGSDFCQLHSSIGVILSPTLLPKIQKHDTLIPFSQQQGEVRKD